MRFEGHQLLKRFCSALALCLCVYAVQPVHAQGDEDESEIPIFFNPNTSTQSIGTQTVRAIRFLTTDDFPPFNFIAPQGNLEGFNVSIARTLCLELKARCTMQAIPWDELEEALKDGRGDAVIAGIKVSEESLERFAFSLPYLRSPARFFTARNRISITPDWTNVSGITVGVQENTAHEAFLRLYFPNVTVQTFEDQNRLNEAVRNGTADAGFGDGISTSFWMNSSRARDCCQFVGGPYVNSDYFGAGFSIAVLPDREDLRKALKKYAEIYLRYFPVNFY